MSGFFEESTEPSRVKATIVADYFWAWAKVIIPSARRHSRRIAYVDLFAGPGRYVDGTKSTPLLVLERAIGDQQMREMLVTVSQPFAGHEVHLWEQYQRFKRMFTDYGDEASEQAQAIGSRIEQVSLKAFKSPWNVHYASHEPEREFSDLLFVNGDLFDAFVKMPNTGGYSFPYSDKPAKAARTHVANEQFNPDFFIKVARAYDILVVEVKAEGDDSNRNRAKCRDGQEHFEDLNERLKDAGEPWRYHFYFLSPQDYTSFFENVKNRTYVGWKSELMQQLDA